MEFTKPLYRGKDVDLTDLGIQEAHGAAAAEKDHIDVAFTSELKRAQHTLAIVLQDDHLESIPVHKNLALNERSYGSLEGLNKAETLKSMVPSRYMEKIQMFSCPMAKV